MSALCPNCGKQLNGAERFCTGCGMQFTGAQQAVQNAYGQQNWQAGYNQQPTGNGYASQLNWQGEYNQPSQIDYNQQNWKADYGQQTAQPDYNQQNWQADYNQQSAQNAYGQQNWKNSYAQQQQYPTNYTQQQYQDAYSQVQYQNTNLQQQYSKIKKPKTGSNKKLWIIIGSILAAIAAITTALVLLLGGRGINGEWFIESIQGDDEALFDAFDADYGAEGLNVSLTFKNGNIYESVIGVRAQVGTYNEKAKTIVATHYDTGEVLGNFSYEIDGDTMTIYSDTGSITLGKK